MKVTVPTINFVLASTTAFLKQKGLESARLEAELLLASALGVDRLHLYLDHERPLTPEETQRYKELIAQRLSGRPLAYILGKKSFLNWDFMVTPEVLIPRPETELLVEKAVEAAGRRVDSGSLLELGTGSGAVAVSLAHYLPEYRIEATDISEEAVKVAGENAKRLGVAGRITFYTGDLYSALPDGKKHTYRGIVSNPPYIPTAIIPTLSREVRAEPVIALDGGDDGLDFYRRIFSQAKEFLAPGGFLALEHGAGQFPPLKELALLSGFIKVSSYKDVAGYDRVIICE